MAGDPATINDVQLVDPQELLRRPSRTQQAEPAAQQVQPRRKPVSGLDAMVSSFANIEDPMTRALAKGLVESEISKTLGFHFSIPDPEDMEMAAAAKRIEIAKMNRQIAADTVDTTKALFLDHPEMHAEWGLKGVDIDTLLESNPDLFVSAAQKAKVTGMTRGLLSLAQVKDTDTASAGPAFQQEQAKKQADVVGTQASIAESVAKLTGAPRGKHGEVLIPEMMQGQAEAALDTAGTALGIDMKPFFGNPLNSDRGALAFADATQIVGRSGPGMAPLVANALLSSKADEIGDVLEEMPVTEGGLLQVQKGDKKGLYLALGLLNIAKQTNRNVTDLFGQMEDVSDQAIGFDLESVSAAAADEIKRLGPEGSQQLSGLLEALNG